MQHLLEAKHELDEAPRSDALQSGDIKSCLHVLPCEFKLGALDCIRIARLTRADATWPAMQGVDQAKNSSAMQTLHQVLRRVE